MRCIFLLFFVIQSVFLNANNYPAKTEGVFSEWNEKRLELFSLFLPHNPIILQAGGHHGTEIIRMAKQWPQGKIISFEPNPHAFQILSSRTKNINNIQIYNFALSHCSGQAPFHICYGSSGSDPAFEHASSLLKPSPSMEIHYRGPIIDVECVELDQWGLGNSLDQVDLISLNLQGSELQVLKSAPEILKKARCVAVHTFLFPFRIDITQYGELKNFLESCGFELLVHWYKEGLEGDAFFVKKDFFRNCEIQDFIDSHSIDGKYRRYFEPFFKTYYDLDDAEDSIKQILKQGFTYEGNISLMIQEFVSPGSIVIDIGAHIGVHTVVMSKKVGPKGAVIAFEPNKKLYMELLNTLNINQCSNVVSISKALSDCYQRVALNGIQIVQETRNDILENFIDAVPLDSLNLNNVSFIKIDVENYEYFVLMGAKDTILRNKPVIIFECWIGADYEKSDPKEKANFKRVMSLMEECGYEVFVIYGNDFIAFPSESAKERARCKFQFQKLAIPK